MLIPRRVIKVICLLLVSIVLSSQLAYVPLSAHERSNNLTDNAMRCDAGQMMANNAKDNCCDSLESNIENQCCFSNVTTSYAIISLSHLNARQPYTLSLINREPSQIRFTIPDLLYRPPIV